MWIVVSTKNINYFKTEIKKTISDIKFYYPKIKNQSKENIRNLLGNYLFCYSSTFNEKKYFLSNLQFLKGLKNILYSEKKKCQNKITNFINYCKCHEDQNGLIQNSFFKERISDKGKILNGPFNDYIFSLIKKDAKKINVLIGEIKVSISDKSKFNYYAL